MYIKEISQLDFLLSNYNVTIMFIVSLSFYVNFQDSVKLMEFIMAFLIIYIIILCSHAYCYMFLKNGKASLSLSRKIFPPPHSSFS